MLKIDVLGLRPYGIHDAVRMVAERHGSPST